MPQLASNWNDAIASAVDVAATSVIQVHNGHRGPASGFAWDEHHALSSAQALGGADDVQLRLADGTGQHAEVIGRDWATDIALLRVATASLTPLELRDADGLKVGHTTVALGRPGKVIRASLRIVGALAQEVRTPGGARLDDYIETDRRLPAGFSGGPLIDLDGKALGLNTRAVFRGADLTIPKATLERVVAELLEHGHVRRGYLGVGVHAVPLPKAVRAELGQRSGALVVSVREHSPAHAAGLVLGDVIVGLDGASVADPDELRAALHGRGPGEIGGRILRAGALQDFRVAIAERS